MSAYEHKHVVGFQETSLVGNVYYAHYVAWQGSCRERFLWEHAPEVIELLSRKEVAFFTANCNCQYIGDWGFVALDEVLVRMTLQSFRGGRMVLAFEYVRAQAPDAVVARGTQEIHCKALRGEEWVPAPFPAPMVRALQPFADSDGLRENLQEALDFQLGADS
jgi:enediyne biosynthesis thioesterase